MECNPLNISTGEHESFTFLEIVSFYVALFTLILICIKCNEDKGLLLFPDTSAELSAAQTLARASLGSNCPLVHNSVQREITCGIQLIPTAPVNTGL